MRYQGQQALIPADHQQFCDDLGMSSSALTEGLEVLWGQSLLHQGKGLTRINHLSSSLSLPPGGKFSSGCGGGHWRALAKSQHRRQLRAFCPDILTWLTEHAFRRIIGE